MMFGPANLVGSEMNVSYTKTVLHYFSPDRARAAEPLAKIEETIFRLICPFKACTCYLGTFNLCQNLNAARMRRKIFLHPVPRRNILECHRFSVLRTFALSLAHPRSKILYSPIQPHRGDQAGSAHTVKAPAFSIPSGGECLVYSLRWCRDQ